MIPTQYTDGPVASIIDQHIKSNNAPEVAVHDRA